jgi:hypothetical protein
MSRMMMARHRTDPGTAERLAAGRLDPDDAPPGYRRVASLLATAGMTPDSRGRAESTDIAAMAAAISEVHATTPDSPRRKTRMLPHIALAKALVVLTAFTLPATAAAATGHLPSSLQDKVANAVEHAGVNIPGGDDADANGKGSDISDTARTTDLTGVDKGAKISNDASNEKSRAGEDHSAPDSNPAGIETPNGGVVDTAGTASDGANSTGADKANDAATTASVNAEGHPTADDHPSADSNPGADRNPSGRP